MPFSIFPRTGPLVGAVVHAGYGEARSMVPGIHKGEQELSGINPAAAALAINGVWSVAADFTRPAVAGPLEVVSTSGSDTAAGVGLRTGVLLYLDASLALKSSVFTTAGVVAVRSDTGTWSPQVSDIFAPLWACGITWGTSNNNVGVLSFQGVGGGTIYEQMAAGYNKTLSARYRIPAGHVGVIREWAGANNALAPGELQLRANMRPDTGDLLGLNQFVNLDSMAIAVAAPRRPFTMQMPLPAGCEVHIRYANLNAAPVTVSAWFNLDLLPIT